MRNLLLIDNRVKDVDTVIQSLTTDTLYVIFDFFSDSLQDIINKITLLNVLEYDSIGFFQENYFSPNYQLIQSFEPSTLDNIEICDPLLLSWQSYESFISYLVNELQIKNIDLLACDIYNDSNWKYVIQYFKNKFNITIECSTDKTGSALQNGNFMLESNNTNLIGKYFTENILKYPFVLAGLTASQLKAMGYTLAQFNSQLYRIWYRDTEDNGWNGGSISFIETNSNSIVTTLTGPQNGTNKWFCIDITFKNGINYQTTKVNGSKPKEMLYAITTISTSSYLKTNTAISMTDLNCIIAQTSNPINSIVFPSNYTLTELIAAGYTLAEFNSFGYTATQLKNFGFTSTQFKAAGYTAIQLKDAGFTATQLKTAAFTATQLKAAGFTLTELKDARFTATQLKDAGFTAAQLKTVGFTATQLKDAGFTATQLKDAGFTLTELKTAGFTASELKTAGFTLTELKTARFTIVELLTAKFTITELLDVGFTATDFKDNINASQLISLGFTATQLLFLGYTARQLISLGFTATQLISLEFTATQLTSAGFTARQLITLGFTATQLLSLEFTATQLTSAGFTATQLISLGFTATQLISLEFTATQLNSAGFTATQLISLGFTPLQLISSQINYSRSKVLSFNYDISVLISDIQVTAYELESSGYYAFEEIASYFDKIEVNNKTELKTVLTTSKFKNVYINNDIELNYKRLSTEKLKVFKTSNVNNISITSRLS